MLPGMAGMTRKESHALTRQRLIETAHRLFLTEGYNATSLDRVAAEAGFSKGAVYSNFATKPELGLAVLDALHLERGLSLVAALEGAVTIDEQLTAFEGWANRNIGDVGWTTFEGEFATSTRMIDEIRPQLAERRQAITDVMAGLIEHVANESGLTLKLPPAEVATYLLALGIGLGVQRAFDPTLPLDSLFYALRDLAGLS